MRKRKVIELSTSHHGGAFVLAWNPYYLVPGCAYRADVLFLSFHMKNYIQIIQQQVFYAKEKNNSA